MKRLDSHLDDLPADVEAEVASISRYRELFDAVQDIVYVRDLNGVIVDINEAGAKFFGMARREMIGRTLHRDFQGPEALSLKSTNERLLEMGIDRSTVETTDAAGEQRILEATTTLFHDAAGNPVGAYGVMRDVTDSMRLQTSLAEANHELFRFTQTLSHEKERTEDALHEAERLRAEAERHREIAERAMATIEADNRRKTVELEEARALQRSMLPSAVPKAPWLDLAVRIRTATEVGGDYYDFCTADDGSMVVAIGDATGHGFRAGILVATAKSYFQTLAPRLPIRDVMQAISSGFDGLRLRSIYLCLALLRIDRFSVTLVSAGMPSFFHRRASGEVLRIDASGTPLGIGGRVVQPEVTFPIGAGDTLVLATDGVVDRVDHSDRELGATALGQWLATATGTADEIADAVMALTDRWGASVEPDDDTTVVVLRLNSDLLPG